MPAARATDERGKRKIREVMKEFKEGDLKSSSGHRVTRRKQAVAIALSEARAAGARVPAKKAAGGGRKRTAPRRGGSRSAGTTRKTSTRS